MFGVGLDLTLLPSIQSLRTGIKHPCKFAVFGPSFLADVFDFSGQSTGGAHRTTAVQTRCEAQCDDECLSAVLARIEFASHSPRRLPKSCPGASRETGRDERTPEGK